MASPNFSSPLDELLKSRGGQQGTFTSNLTPNPLPMDPFAVVKSSSQLANFYGRLGAIGQKTEEQRASAEDQIYRTLQKQKEKALINKLKAMMPVSLPSSSLPNYSGTAPGFPSTNRGTSSIGGDIRLPVIKPPSVLPPLVAPPPKTSNCTAIGKLLGQC